MPEPNRITQEELEQMYDQMEEQERGESKVSGDAVQKAVHQLLGDPHQLASYCHQRFLDYRGRHPFSGTLEDPANKRRYIQYLMGGDDVTIGLGAVFSLTSDEFCATRSEPQSPGMKAHRSGIMERTFDLVGLLAEMCHGPGREAARARMQTLIRYMLENNYQQGTEAVEMLCSGEEQEYMDLTYGGTARWGLSLSEGGKAYDLGCGPGRALDVLEQRVGKGNAIGYEMNPRWALHDERIKLGIIDHSQSKLLLGREGARERLSFSERFGTASFVLASLVMDRVANQYELLQNCSKLVRPGGTLGIALLLPVSIEDDEPGLGQRLRYVVDPITEGEDVNVDTQLIVGQLETLGFDRVMRKHLPVRDPITNGMYDNHHLIVAQKRGK